MSAYSLHIFTTTYHLDLLRSVFVLEAPSTPTSVELPPVLLAFAQLIHSQTEWERAKSKGKLPKPKADIDTLKIIQEALARRSEAYPTTLEVRPKNWLVHQCCPVLIIIH